MAKGCKRRRWVPKDLRHLHKGELSQNRIAIRGTRGPLGETDREEKHVLLKEGLALVHHLQQDGQGEKSSRKASTRKHLRA